MQEEEVTLGEMINDGSQNTFEVTVSNPNGTTDMHSDNDFMSSDFEEVPVYKKSIFGAFEDEQLWQSKFMENRK